MLPFESIIEVLTDKQDYGDLIEMFGYLARKILLIFEQKLCNYIIDAVSQNHNENENASFISI